MAMTMISNLNYLKPGAGYDCPGQVRDVTSFKFTSNVLLFDSLGIFGGELPTGSKINEFSIPCP